MNDSAQELPLPGGDFFNFAEQEQGNGGLGGPYSPPPVYTPVPELMEPGAHLFLGPSALNLDSLPHSAFSIDRSVSFLAVIVKVSLNGHNRSF